tara:strand:- start:8798 stop:10051 length:1254 start_codon:yes stop_codon:yes gene_type:complete
MNKIFKSIIALGLLLLLVKASWYSYLFKGIYVTYLRGHTTANIFDGEDFEKGHISAQAPAQWPIKYSEKYAPSLELQETLEEIETGAFLVFDRDTLRYEYYENDVTQESKTNSFSMAKSIVTILVQIAIQEGDISSWDEQVLKYIPELKGPGSSILTLANLSGMTADIDWNEDYYNPFGIQAKAYYGSDLYQTLVKREIGPEVGLRFKYQSAATSLLGFCLEAATGKKIYDYASEKLWTPLGAESDAFWHLDETGNALSYCCYNAIARDYGRLGKLILDNGYWNGERIVDSSFLKSATTPGTHQYYGLSFWIGTVPSNQSAEKDPYIAFNGHLGQWIIALPNSNRVIVRTGHSKGGESEALSPFMLTVKEYGNTIKIISDLQVNIKQNVTEDSNSYEPKESPRESDALPLNNDDLEN